MRHDRSLDFEDLEERKLLSRLHPAHVHAAHARVAHVHVARAPVVTVPLVLDGTLAVDGKAATMTTNADGSSTTTTPVAGVLSGVGKVRGVWSESVDSFGQYQGPDTLRLTDAQGSFVLRFSTAHAGKGHKSGHGVVLNATPQQFAAGTGAYVKASETGTIQLTTNATKSSVMSMTLVTTKS